MAIMWNFWGLIHTNAANSAPEASGKPLTVPEALTPTLADLALLRADHEALQKRMDELTLAVADGIGRTERAESRIKNTVYRAKQKLAASGLSDPALDAEADDLPPSDGEGVAPVPAVQQSVEEATDVPSSVPGVTVGQLRRGRMLR